MNKKRGKVFRILRNGGRATGKRPGVFPGPGNNVGRFFSIAPLYQPLFCEIDDGVQGRHDKADEEDSADCLRVVGEVERHSDVEAHARNLKKLLTL